MAVMVCSQFCSEIIMFSLNAALSIKNKCISKCSDTFVFVLLFVCLFSFKCIAHKARNMKKIVSRLI